MYFKNLIALIIINKYILQINITFIQGYQPRSKKKKEDTTGSWSALPYD